MHIGPNPRNILGVLSRCRSQRWPAVFGSCDVRDLRGSYKWSLGLWERWEESSVGEEGARTTQETPRSSWASSTPTIHTPP